VFQPSAKMKQVQSLYPEIKCLEVSLSKIVFRKLKVSAHYYSAQSLELVCCIAMERSTTVGSNGRVTPQ